MNLTALNNFMKNYPSGRIVPEQYVKSEVWDMMKNSVDRTAFRGEYIEVLIQTGFAYATRGMAETDEFTTGGTMGFSKQLIPIKKLSTIATLSGDAMRRASGGENSWGNLVDMSLRQMLDIDFKHHMEIAALGNGTAALARVVSVANDGGSNGVYTYTVTCDNTYTDSGIENVQLLKKGMRVDIYDGTALTNADCSDLVVTNVTYGNRANGAATTGTFQFKSTVNSLESAIADNDVIYVAGSYNKFPMGLQGIYQGSGDGFSGVWDVSTFQNLTRSAFPTTVARVLQATDFGLSIENPTDGTPTYFDLSVLTDADDQAFADSGHRITHWVMHGDTAKAIARKNKHENNITVNVSSVDGMVQAAQGGRNAQFIENSDGQKIPIVRSTCFPRNCAMGVCVDDLGVHPMGDFDYWKNYGEIWEPSRGNRRDEFDAPYGGYINNSADRCDSGILIQDLATNS